jgi:hypothetical protein
MKKRMIAALSGLICLFSACALISRPIYLSAQNPSPIGPRVAFSATIVEKQYSGPDNTVVFEEQSRVAIRRDGTESIIVNRKARDGVVYELRTVTNPHSRRRSAYFGPLKAVVTYVLSDAEVAALVTPNTSCKQERTAPHSNVLGFDTVAVSQTFPAPGLPEHRTRIERWLALDLDCYPVREERWLVDAHDVAKLVATWEVKTILMGEPDPEFFSGKPDFKEMPPSQLMSEYADRFGGKADPRAKELLDRGYQSRQEKK